MTKTLRSIFFSTFLLFSTDATVLAGPPFLTDDPEPVDYRHWEFYLASVQSFSGSEIDATCPHFEANYGALPNVQVHLLLPVEYVRANRTTHYGFSNTEIGMKLRFVEESDSRPQAGTFVMVEIPTASSSVASDQRHVQVFVPPWLQKSWGKCTTYGGGGLWYNPGAGKRNWYFAGWELQYDFSKIVTMGGELYYETAEEQDGESNLGFNIGGIINFDDANHLLFSIGRAVTGPDFFTGYIAYQLTI
jgi:hypothetical protein